ncbi:hypothetical protein PN462_18265 [Spirulina sp. CS-785/01]|uniref:hypothetical protein n=1 Tax=Spirulina sp. CS-785/01 TaxID=3021716 RepID=UPI0023301721|nr:hypothetical protein [Spirulina sp. CS-785/01]MDB9315065.1 hypothetical protein [Spirulina sp. CS-785/01]
MVSKNIYTRFSIFWGIKGMLSLFQEYVDALKNAEGHYELWRDRFMKAGLLLGIAIASACIVT